MLSRIVPLAFLSSLAVAQIYDNGPLKTGVNGANDISQLQSGAPLNMNIIGFGHNIASAVSWADQFTVANSLTISEIEVYGYLTGATTNGCTGIQIALYDGNPSTGTPAQLLAGAGMVASGGTQLPVSVAGTVTGNYTCSTGWAEATPGVPLYRAAFGTQASTARRVQKVNVALATPLVLTAGTYYLHYGTVGLSFCPPRTTLKQLQTGGTSDCIQLITATWGPIVDTGWNGTAAVYSPGIPQGMPFKLYGVGGALGSITNYGGAGGGAPGAAFNVDGAPVVGGYVRADLTGVNPAAVGVILASSNFPFGGGSGIPLGCGATWNAEADFTFVAAGFGVGVSMETQIPISAGLQGANLRFQGAEIDPLNNNILGCDLGGGFQFSLTDAFNYVLNTN